MNPRDEDYASQVQFAKNVDTKLEALRLKCHTDKRLPLLLIAVDSPESSVIGEPRLATYNVYVLGDIPNANVIWLLRNAAQQFADRDNVGQEVVYGPQ